MDLALSASTQTWDLLSRQVTEFVTAWERGAQPPTLDEFLPAEPATLRRLAIVELVKIDLAYRWKQRSAVLAKDATTTMPSPTDETLDVSPRAQVLWIEQYVDRYPELNAEGGPPSDLIYEEYHVRRSAGEPVEPSDYLERFPTRADELRRLMKLEQPLASTALFRAGKPREKLKAGDQVDDFDLIVPLGEGAFAQVFLARQRSMQRLVALKISDDRGNEPQTLAQLDHANIVRVYDQRRVPEQMMRLLYMQYVAGGTFEAVIERVRRVPADARTGRILLETVDEQMERSGQPTSGESSSRRRLAAMSWPQVVCRLGAQLAQALDYAHRKGVLHRDIKPANVLLAADATPKLADFNISFSSQLEGVTPAAYFGGSLAYMSPEQLEACNPKHPRQPEELDGRSDIYSLAVMLWELLSGERPFGDEKIAGNWTGTLEQMIARRRAGPSGQGHGAESNDCQAHLRDVLLKCLAPDPVDRHSSGDELARDLRLCLQPHTQRLMQAAPRDWRKWVRRAPLLTVLLAALIPNLVAAVFNYFYNWESYVKLLPESQQMIWRVQVPPINGIAFSLGIFWALYLTWPLVLGVRNLRTAQSGTVPPTHFLLRRALRLGQHAALIGIIEWTIAGLMFPVVVHVVSGHADVQLYLQFVASLTLCGLIAASYPFFFVTYFCVHVFYPAILRNDSAAEADAGDLKLLRKRAGAFLLLAGGVPLLGVAMIVLNALLTGAQNTFILGVLSAVGAFGFFLAYAMYNAIQHDLAALSVTAAPPDAFGTSSESFEAF
jgi:serine/threonine protein kinase